MVKIKYFKTVFFLFFLFSLTAIGNEIYVSPDGSDSGQGTISSPYRTISYAVEQAQSGDTVIVREGEYNEAVRIRVPITLKNYPGEHVKIYTGINDENIDTTLTIDVDADGTIIDGLEITGGYYYGIALFTKWDWGEEDRSGATDVTIKNCNIHHTGRDCIKLTPECDRVTIENCEIHHSGARYDENSEGIDNVNCDYMVVKDCYIHDTGSTGVYVKGGGTNAVIERNIVENCGELGVAIGFDTSPEYFDTDTNPERYEAIDSVVRNCLIINTHYAGIAFYAAKNCAAYNNTLINTANADQSEIYFGVSLQDWEADPNPNDGIGYRPPNTGITVENNIVYRNNSATTPAVYIRTFYHEGDVGRVNGYKDGEMPDMDYNCYYHTNSTPAFYDLRPNSTMEDANLSQWQSHINNESHSFVQNPVLTEEYKLGDGSPCIGAGDSNVPVTDDLDGNTRTSPYDMGCYKTNSGSNEEEGTAYYFTHIAHRNYTTYLLAYNPSEEIAQFTLKVADSNGYVRVTQDFSIQPFSTKKIKISDFANGEGMSAKVYLKSGNAIFKGVYFNTDNGMAEFLLESSLHNKLAYTFPSYNNSITWNGIVIFNGSLQTVTVTIKAYKDGNEVGSSQMSLAPFTKTAQVVGSEGGMFPDLGIDGFDFITVETGSPSISGLNISGEGQEKLVFTPAITLP